MNFSKMVLFFQIKPSPEKRIITPDLDKKIGTLKRKNVRIIAMLNKLKTNLRDRKILNLNSSLFQFLDSNSFYIDEIESENEGESENENEIEIDDEGEDDAIQEDQPDEDDQSGDADSVIQNEGPIPDFCQKKEVKLFDLKVFISIYFTKLFILS